ncbi:hypothetical protein EV567_1239 [Streptomyces sp. BK239]|nr:hypothetical protein EV567_1239 [Streptomyces sp. BK239]
MPGPVLSRTPRTVLGVLVARVRSASGAQGSCPWSGDAGAGFLTPGDAWSGLDGPMPRTITPVVWGRCRPSPDRVSQGAPSDRHGRCVVASGFAGGAGEGPLPVLGAPAAGVGRVDGDHRDARGVGHRRQPGTEPAGGHAGDQPAEALVAAVFLSGLLGGEVQVLHGDRLHTAGADPVQEAGESVADLGVAVLGGAGQVVGEAARGADRIAVDVQTPGGQVVGVHVDADHPGCERGLDGNGRGGRDLPGGGHIPAGAAGVVVDAVGDRPVCSDTVRPLLTPVRERDPAGQDVPAVRGVRQMRERCGELEAHLAVGAHADGFVSVAFAGLAVRLAEPALRLPPPAPDGLRQLGRLQVMPGAGQPFAAAHDVDEAGLAVGPRGRQPVLQHPQPPRLRVPLPLRLVPPGRLLRALLPDGLGQTVCEGADAGFQVLDVRELAAAGQRPLIVRGLGDAARPPRRRHSRQFPLTHRPCPGGVLQPVPTARLEVPRRQRPQMRTHQTQHLLISGRQLLQAGPDSHTTRAGRDERLRHIPQHTHPTTPSPRCR